MILKKTFSKKDIRVAIVAIAKNEAAYLTDWVHHHKYFGFDGIFIGLNRTTDKSDEVIKKLQKKYNDVFAINVDWIDRGYPQIKNPNMQSLSYAYLTNLILEEKKTNYSHILYIDIDEFWFYKDFKTDIKEYLRSLPEFDAVSLNWLVQPGDPEPFNPPFKNLRCNPAVLVKSLITTQLAKNVIHYRCHFPQIHPREGSYTRLDANGTSFTYGEHQEVSASAPNLDSRAFILHRAQRSEKEYVALLRRERPGLDLPIKDNRAGFNLEAKSDVFIDPILLTKYWASLDKLVKHCKIDKTLKTAQKSIDLLCDTILNINPQILSQHALLYIRMLKGTNMEMEVLRKLEESKDIVIRDEHGPAFHLCANYYLSKRLYDTALRYIDLALLCRPNGPAVIASANKIQRLAEEKL